MRTELDRVAEAIRRSHWLDGKATIPWERVPPDSQEVYRRYARAAIAAMAKPEPEIDPYYEAALRAMHLCSRTTPEIDRAVAHAVAAAFCVHKELT